MLCIGGRLCILPSVLLLVFLFTTLTTLAKMEEDSPEGWFYLGTDGTENGPLNFSDHKSTLEAWYPPS